MSYKYLGPDGYYLNNNNIDSFGVDHSGFSTRDELEYQYNRITNRDKMQPNGSFGTPPSALSLLTNQYKNSLNGGYTHPSQWGLFPQQSSFTGTQYAQLATSNTMSDASTAQPVDYSRYGEGFSQEFIDQMLNDTDYQRALQEYAIPNEGEYINLANDPGRETNMGISRRYHPNENIRGLTRERANAILYDEVWNWNGINRLPREVRGFVFDHGIRTSPQNAIETTHRALGINPVGNIIGSTTLDLLQNMGYEEFLRRYQNLVREQDRNNRNYRSFGTGWDNRTNGYHVSY